jgi:hypothetical protein
VPSQRLKLTGAVLLSFSASVWPMAEEDPDTAGWASAWLKEGNVASV